MIFLRILDRFVLGAFIRLFLIFVLGAPLLFVLGDVTENLDRYLDQGVPVRDVVLSYAFEYPQFIAWAFPIAALLAAVFTVHPMTAHQEVMAAKAGGVSFHRLVLPIVVASALLAVAGLGLTEVVPRTTRMAAELRGERARTQNWRNNFVYLTDTGESLVADRLTSLDGRLTGVSLQTLPRIPGESAVRYIQARDGRWEEEAGWTFFDGFQRVIHPDGEEVTLRFDRMLVRGLKERPEEMLEVSRDEDQMTYAELTAFGERVLRSGGSPGRALTKREQRIAIPVATLVIVLFGAPLATSSRRGGAAFGIGLALGTTILYLMLFRISGAFGYAETLGPTAAAWIPNGVFLATGLALMARVRT